MLKNGSFTEGWTDLPPAPGWLINQQPNGWILRWLEPGESLFGDDATSKGVPECVHKLARQLPVEEQLGAKNALILEGDAVYKIFHGGSPFGAELKQTVTGLEPGTIAKLTVPIQTHIHGDRDPYGSESGVWVNGEGEWIHSGIMGDRKWYKHKVEFTVPEDGSAEIAIRVKTKWSGKDFFFDGIKLEAVEASTTVEPTPVEPTIDKPDIVDPTDLTGPDESSNVVKISVPAGVRVVTAAGDALDLVVVTVPNNLTVKIV